MFLLAAQKSLLVDCPTQMAFVKRICQLCSMTNTSEKYEKNTARKSARIVCHYRWVAQVAISC